MILLCSVLFLHKNERKKEKKKKKSMRLCHAMLCNALVSHTFEIRKCLLPKCPPVANRKRFIYQMKRKWMFWALIAICFIFGFYFLRCILTKTVSTQNQRFTIFFFVFGWQIDRSFDHLIDLIIWLRTLTIKLNTVFFCVHLSMRITKRLTKITIYRRHFRTDCSPYLVMYLLHSVSK